jgi:hypothetical protein
MTMTEDLLLSQMASVTVFAHFHRRSEGVGIELAGGKAFISRVKAVVVPTTIVVGLPSLLPLSMVTRGRSGSESGYNSSLHRPPFTYCGALTSSHRLVIIQAGMMKEGWSNELRFCG